MDRDEALWIIRCEFKGIAVEKRREAAVWLLKSDDEAVTTDDRREAAVWLLRMSEGGVQEWDRLRIEAFRAGDVSPCGAYLRSPDLQGAQLGDANLQRAQLWRADLQGAQLWRANLQEADLRRANLQGAQLGGANLQGAQLGGANLQGAYLRRANLQEADLEDANLQGAYLEGAELRRADLRNVEHAYHAPTTPAWISEPYKDWTRLLSRTWAGLPLLWALRGIRLLAQQSMRRQKACFSPAFRLDSTYAQGALMPADARDPWTVLRRNYTGPMFAFHLLLLVVFVLPIVGRAAFWSAVGEGEAHATRALDRLEERSENWRATMKARLQIEPEDVPAGGPLSDAGRAALEQCNREIAQRVDAIDTADLKREIKARLPGGGKKHWLATRVCGLSRGLLPFFVFCCAAVYNAMRVYLTRRVGILRDREEQTGMSPGWSEYGRLVTIHLFANGLTTFTFIAAGSDFIPLLFTLT